jgi:hypothetical protein
MQKMNFSKKRLSPIIEKFNIDVENDTMFGEIIKLFGNQTDYQIWGIKLVYDGQCAFEQLVQYYEWAKNNKTEIKNLSKGNLIGYKTSKELFDLEHEMRNIGNYNLVKSVIDKFNTEQRHVIFDVVLQAFENSHYNFSPIHSEEVNDYINTFKMFSKLPDHKQHKIIVQASSMSTFKEIYAHIKSSFGDTYLWDRESLLMFVENFTKDSPVIYDKDNIVIVKVTSYDSSKKLCGKGATSWCITKAESYFKQYVGDKPNAIQYFLFNFNLPERDELSHVGFTVDMSSGKITNAHSTMNNNLCCDFRYKGTSVNINSILMGNKVPSHIYLKLGELKNFKWDVDSIVEYCNKNNIEIVLVNGSIIVIQPKHRIEMSKLVGHSVIKSDSTNINDKTHKMFVVMNTSVEFNDDNALMVLDYGEDEWSEMSMVNATNLYGKKFEANKVWKTFGIKESDFITLNESNINILLHKYIEHQNEDDAIVLVVENENLDVNYNHNFKLPIHTALSKGMYEVCSTILRHKTYNCSLKDGFGETFGNLMLYKRINGKCDELNALIDNYISNENIDINTPNSCNETMLHIAVEHPTNNDIVAKLLGSSRTNPNVINEFGSSALTNAIRAKNSEAIAMLLNRKDTVVRKEDYSVADANGIDLKSMVEASNKNNKSSDDDCKDIVAMLKNIIAEKLNI